jgi:hypothetical protein
MTRSDRRRLARAIPAGDVRPLALAVAALALMTGCQVSVGGGLDTDAVEAEISRGIEEQTDAAVQSVDCPDDVDAEAGNSFTCSVTAEDGSTATVDVTQEDDEGNVSWELRGS